MKNVLIGIAMLVTASTSSAETSLAYIDAHSCRTDELINSAFDKGKSKIEKAIGKIDDNSGKTFLVDFRITKDGHFDEVNVKPETANDQKLVPAITRIVSGLNAGPSTCGDQYVKAYPIRAQGKLVF